MSAVIKSHLARPCQVPEHTCERTRTHRRTLLFGCETQGPREKNQRKGYPRGPFFFLVLRKKKKKAHDYSFLL